MPCRCDYYPTDMELIRWKILCEDLVKHVKSLEQHGDVRNCTWKDTLKTLDHLYTGQCSEKEKSHESK